MNNTVPIQDYKAPIKYDGAVQISTGKSRFEKKWKNKNMQWSALVAKLQRPVITPETYAEYKKMSKADQDNIKDVGGYVGGSLTGGRRGATTVAGRQILTLDLDFAPVDYFDDLELMSSYAACTYSTHKHSASTPRYRLLIPLDRVVSAEEYEAISRKIAEDIGIDYFDDTTYQPSRLMYWPSVSSDGEYVCRYIDAPFLCADAVLDRYPDWRDASYWPESSRTSGIRKKLAEKQGDPTEKKGIIGAFCRTYTVPEAIEKFLPETYVQCAMEDRYTYTGGSTAAGLVIYEDGLFAYSNHGTDPASGKLCNAFDLVRIHLFGEQDDDVPPAADTTKLPSYKAMMEMAVEDKDTKLRLGAEKREAALEEFGDDENVDVWELLTVDKHGEPVNSLKNVTAILKHDSSLKGIVYNQQSESLEIRRDMDVPWAHPNRFWRDADDAHLVGYLGDNYAEFSQVNIKNAITRVADERAYHPIREYLDTLPVWDGVKRVDTLLIDYLGAVDSAYVRAVTAKTLIAAIARVKQPGCKFDNILVLNGPQGVGKSTLIAKLGGEWYSDSLSLNDTKDKTAAEKLQGYWIMEIGELAGMRKTDVETLKAFISRQNDIYRGAYGQRTYPHNRQCVFIGTTNATDGFLRDITGNRRFWPVEVGQGRKAPWGLTEGEIGQIWAEALERYEKGERDLYLKGKELEEAGIMQDNALESDPREGMVREYLDTLLPKNWYEWNLPRRKAFIQGSDFEDEVGTEQRMAVCCSEIWYECFGKDKGNITRRDSQEIASIMKKIPGWEPAGKAKRIAGYGVVKCYQRL